MLKVLRHHYNPNPSEEHAQGRCPCPVERCPLVVIDTRHLARHYPSNWVPSPRFHHHHKQGFDNVEYCGIRTDLAVVRHSGGQTLGADWVNVESSWSILLPAVHLIWHWRRPAMDWSERESLAIECSVTSAQAVVCYHNRLVGEWCMHVWPDHCHCTREPSPRVRSRSHPCYPISDLGWIWRYLGKESFRIAFLFGDQEESCRRRGTPKDREDRFCAEDRIVSHDVHAQIPTKTNGQGRWVPSLIDSFTFLCCRRTWRGYSSGSNTRSA